MSAAQAPGQPTLSKHAHVDVATVQCRADTLRQFGMRLSTRCCRMILMRCLDAFKLMTNVCRKPRMTIT